MKFLFALLGLLFAGPALADPVSGLVALGTAFGATASTALVTGLMVAGSAISIVGTITGSKKLARFGALVSLAGGVGAGYQALTAAAAPVAESSAAAALSQTPVAAEAAAVSGGEAVARGLEEAVPGLINQGAAAAAPAAAEAAAPALSGVDQALADAGAGATRTAAAASNPVADALTTASKHVGTFLKENKELVKLGAGAINGVMNRSAAAEGREAEWAREDQRRADYNAGIQSGSAIPFRVKPGVNVTQVPVQDPNRYIPQRGLINQNTGG